MFGVIGGVVVYGFAFFGLVQYLRRVRLSESGRTTDEVSS